MLPHIGELPVSSSISLGDTAMDCRSQYLAKVPCGQVRQWIADASPHFLRIEREGILNGNGLPYGLVEPDWFRYLAIYPKCA